MTKKVNRVKRESRGDFRESRNSSGVSSHSRQIKECKRWGVLVGGGVCLWVGGGGEWWGGGLLGVGGGGGGSTLPPAGAVASPGAGRKLPSQWGKEDCQASVIFRRAGGFGKKPQKNDAKWSNEKGGRHQSGEKKKRRERSREAEKKPIGRQIDVQRGRGTSRLDRSKAAY